MWIEFYCAVFCVLNIVEILNVAIYIPVIQWNGVESNINIIMCSDHDRSEFKQLQVHLIEL